MGNLERYILCHLQITEETVESIDDPSLRCLEHIIPSLGDRIALKAFCAPHKTGNTSRRKRLFDILQSKLDMRKGSADDSSQTGTRQVSTNARLGNQNASKTTRVVEFGWIHNGHPVRARRGGGTRTVRAVPKTADKLLLQQRSENLFFPNGSNKFAGQLTDLAVDMTDGLGTPLQSHDNVMSLYEQLQVPKLRIYLSTFSNDTECESTSTSTAEPLENTESTSISETRPEPQQMPSKAEPEESINAESKDILQLAWNQTWDDEVHPGKLPGLETSSSNDDTLPLEGITVDCLEEKRQKSVVSLYSGKPSVISCYTLEQCRDISALQNPEVLENTFAPEDAGFVLAPPTSTQALTVPSTCISYSLMPVFPVTRQHLEIASVSTPLGSSAPYSDCLKSEVTHTSQLTLDPTPIAESSPNCATKHSIESSIPTLSLPLSPPSDDKRQETSLDLPATCSVSQSFPEVPVESLVMGQEIGSGAHGLVNKAKWLGTDVAVKRFLWQRSRHRMAVESAVLKEVNVHSKVRHPNIVQLMGVSFGPTSLLLIFELVNGANLEDIIFGSNSIPLSADNKNTILKQVCQAIAYLHGLTKPIVHQDIKPANIIVDREHMVAKVCDLGISKIASYNTQTSVTGHNLPGTCTYMAPELFQSRNSSCASDIWSLGCTILELVTEMDTWDLDLAGDYYMYVQMANKALNKELPPRIQLLSSPVLQRCLSLAPSDRPTALDLANHFCELCSHGDVAQYKGAS